MIPAKKNLSLYRGDTERWAYRLWADKLKTIPIDLTDVEVESQIREKPGGTTIVNLDVDTVEDVDTGVLQIVVVDLKTVHWDVIGSLRSGAWDLQLTDAEGNVLTPVAGTVAITTDVTDSTL